MEVCKLRTYGLNNVRKLFRSASENRRQIIAKVLEKVVDVRRVLGVFRESLFWSGLIESTLQ